MFGSREHCSGAPCAPKALWRRHLSPHDVEIIRRFEWVRLYTGLPETSGVPASPARVLGQVVKQLLLVAQNRVP